MLIPVKAYRLVEQKLRERDSLEEKAERRLREARQRAVSIAGPPTDKPSVQSAGQQSRVEGALLLIRQAEEQLDAARKWLDVFRMADAKFPPSSMEWKVVDRLYRQGKKQKQAAMEMYINKNTVQLFKDRYVYYAAFMAAEEGLVRVREEEQNG